MADKKDLVGGAVFFRSDTFISKLIRWSGLFQKGHTIDNWSHVGDIWMINGELHLVEALFEGVVTRPLFEALQERTKNGGIFEIKKLKPHIKRSFQEEKYNAEIIKCLGNEYDYLGAVAAGLDKPVDFKKKKASHCSYYSTRFKIAGNALNKDQNPREWTPQDCYNYGIYEGTGK